MKNDMLKQIQEMQKAAMEMQEKFKNLNANGSAAGGVVQATVNLYDNSVSSIKFHNSASTSDVLGDPVDLQMFCDLCLVAVNNAIEEANRMRNEHMSQLTGGMGSFLS